MMKAGEVRRARMSLGLKQYQAAMVFGLAPETMNRIEKGHLGCPPYVETGLIAMNASEDALDAVKRHWGLEVDG